jgi:hypothetical protein
MNILYDKYHAICNDDEYNQIFKIPVRGDLFDILKNDSEDSISKCYSELDVSEKLDAIFKGVSIDLVNIDDLSNCCCLECLRAEALLYYWPLILISIYIDPVSVNSHFIYNFVFNRCDEQKHFSMVFTDMERIVTKSILSRNIVLVEGAEYNRYPEKYKKYRASKEKSISNMRLFLGLQAGKICL